MAGKSMENNINPKNILYVFVNNEVLLITCVILTNIDTWSTDKLYIDIFC